MRTINSSIQGMGVAAFGRFCEYIASATTEPVNPKIALQWLNQSVKFLGGAPFSSEEQRRSVVRVLTLLFDRARQETEAGQMPMETFLQWCDLAEACTPIDRPEEREINHDAGTQFMRRFSNEYWVKVGKDD